MTSLNWYLQDAAALLNDNSFQFTSQPQLTRWINASRYECAMRSGCIRRFLTGQSAWGASAQPGSIIPGGLQPGALPGAGATTQGAATGPVQAYTGIERYPYQGILNPALRAAYAGVKGIIDVVTVSVSWGTGSSKPQLDWMAWEEFQAYVRSINTLVTSYPCAWTVYNDGEFGEVWLGPVPSSSGDMELDTLCVPDDLNTNQDFEAIPNSYGRAIKFGAAKLAFMTRQNYSQAQIMENQFADAMGVARVAVNFGKPGPAYPAGMF